MSGAPRKSPESLRSARWFAPDDLRSFGHRSRLMQLGYSEEDFRGQADHRRAQHLVGAQFLPRAFSRTRGQDVKRGVTQAGGFAVEMPAICRSTRASPSRRRCSTATCWRWRRRSMIRSHPLDGVVLMGGCDKTTPGLVMGAITAGVPMIYPAGRTDAARQLRRQAAWLRLGRLEILGRAARRQHLRRGVAAASRAASRARRASA